MSDGYGPLGGGDRDDEPISVVPFPTLAPAALQGIPGKIVEAVAPHTEAHPAAILVQYLAIFGVTIGAGPHVWADNREHCARINPLIVGKTSDGAKGTSYGVAAALFDAVEYPTSGARTDLRPAPHTDPLRKVSGLSSGEGLIESVRDASGDNADAKGFDEGVEDKRLLVVEEEFANVLAAMERQGSTLPGIVRSAWDGSVLRTLTRSPLVATGAHITIIGHVTPGELRLKLKDAQLLGGTMNRFPPVASRRTKFLHDGGNIPPETLSEYAPLIAKALTDGSAVRRVERTATANELWRDAYPALRRARPDGPVASILARAVPNVLRLSLAYALADGRSVIDEEHMRGALAIWDYVEATAEWMFGKHVDHGEVDALVSFIVAGGATGRSRAEISSGFYNRNRPAADIGAVLGGLVRDGRVRQDVDRTGVGRPTVRYFAC